MAAYTVKASISISGGDILTGEDVKRALLDMLSSYADSDEDVPEVAIHIDSMVRNSF